MVDSWKYLDEIIASYPDNTQGLIKAEDSREHTFSDAVFIGGVVNGGGIVGPGIDVNMNPNLSNEYLGGQGYIMDGNGQLVVDIDGSATIPANYTRILEVTCQFTFESSTNTTTTFAISVNGVTLEYSTIVVEWTSQTVGMPVFVTAMTGTGIDGLYPITMVQTKVTGNGIIDNFSMYAKSFLAASDSGVAPLNFFDGQNRMPPI